MYDVSLYCVYVVLKHVGYHGKYEIMWQLLWIVVYSSTVHLNKVLPSYIFEIELNVLVC